MLRKSLIAGITLFALAVIATEATANDTRLDDTKKVTRKTTSSKAIRGTYVALDRSERTALTAATMRVSTARLKAARGTAAAESLDPIVPWVLIAVIAVAFALVVIIA